jgi:hypothetical protein
VKRPRPARRVTVVVRGCRFRVRPEHVAEIRAEEARQIRADWDANRVD